MLKRYFLPVFIVLAFSACLWYFFQRWGSEKPVGKQLAFYIWNNELDIDSAQTNFLSAHNIGHLRIKIFELGWDGEKERTIVDNSVAVHLRPEAKKYLLENRITPVVFLPNHLFYTIDSAAVPALASLVKKAMKVHLPDLVLDHEDVFPSHWDRLYFSFNTRPNAYDSLQKAYEKFMKNIVSYEFDCDWTEKTKNRYFYFLKNIKDSLQLPVETTLRLHQYKYRNKMGIPPADAANLMCYNMGNLKDAKETNSIFDKKVMMSYLEKQVGEYPLKLNVAFPLFSWTVVFRNGKFLRLVPGNKILEQNSESLEQIANHFYRVTAENIYINWRTEPLEQNDVLRIEQVAASDIKEANALVQKAGIRPQEIIFFDLQNAVSNQNYHELEEIIGP